MLTFESSVESDIRGRSVRGEDDKQCGVRTDVFNHGLVFTTEFS